RFCVDELSTQERKREEKTRLLGDQKMMKIRVLTQEIILVMIFQVLHEDMGEADIILGIRIEHKISTPMDTSKKLIPNNGKVVSQLEYSMVIDCLMYSMTYTRPDIAFALGKLSRYTSNPST
nr:zinc finger, CCHC-type [Tanacetum cinerariifolium]